MGMLSKAKSVPDIPKNLFTVLYGPPGVGKTILGARTGNRTLIATDENAAVSVSQFPDLAANTDVIKINSYAELTKLCAELATESHDYDHFMIDTFDGIVRKKLKEQRTTVQFKRGHKDINSLEDYNLLNNHMFDFIARLTMIPCSVTVTSHDRIPDQQQYVKGDRLLRPSIPFRVFECLNGYANVVGYVYMMKHNGETHRIVSVVPNDEHEAKNHLRMEKSVTDDNFVKTVRNWKGI